jgi:hypothetical protein
MYNEQKVNAIRAAINTKNRFMDTENLFEIVKFGYEKITLKKCRLINTTRGRNFFLTIDTKTLNNLIYFFILINSLCSLCTSIGSI